MPVQLPIALSVAGSDSGGGAGIQADLKTFHAFGAFGTTVVTAITAQNTRGVFAIHPVPLGMVSAQFDALREDLPPAGIKSGMLASAQLVETVAAGIRELRGVPYVLDPVMVASSGNRLLEADAESSLILHLLPLATLVTPNLHEAEILTGTEIRTVEQARAAARALVDMGAGAALVKGGHLAGGEAVDILWTGAEEHMWRRPRVETRNTHGTGCTLSAAAAAALAHGDDLVRAVDRAVQFVAQAIHTAPDLGSGSGPLNHFAPTPD
jgi:hydroxymethylpyrimidine/phosphomethylpyrimidine kinase